MTPRLKMFAWEQRRLSNWVLGAMAFSIMGSLIASISLIVPGNLDEARSAGMFGRILYALIARISEKDAVALADGYAVIAILITLFGTLLTDGSKIRLDLANRLLRLPLPSWELAWAWTLSRTVFAATAMLIILLVRHAFVNVPTELHFLPAFCHYLGGFLLFQGIARVVSAWDEKATVIAVIMLAAVLGFAEYPLWKLANAFPPAPLLVGAIIGLPMASVGILLRRRGGIVFEIGRPVFLGSAETYAQVAAIPGFSSPLDAQQWFEKRRYGWHFPAICLVLAVAANGAAYFGAGREHGAWFRADVLFGYLFGIPLVGGAAFMAMQFAAVDNVLLKKSRFLHVRPVRAHTFVRARIRMLALSAAQGLGITALGVLTVIGLLVFVVGTGAVAHSAGVRPSTAYRGISSIAEAFFTTKYDYYGNASAGSSADFVWSLVCYGVFLAAAFVFFNREVLITALVAMFIAAQLSWSFVPDIGVPDWIARLLLIAFAPVFLLGLTCWNAYRSGNVSPRGVLLRVVIWLVAWGTGIALLSEYYSNVSIFALVRVVPIDMLFAVVLCAPLSMATSFDAVRTGSWFPPRRPQSAGGWHEARGVFAGTAAALALVLIGVFGWRAMVVRSVRDELAMANSLGVGPRSPKVEAPENKWLAARYDFADLSPALMALGARFEPGTRRVKCDSTRQHTIGVFDVIVPPDNGSFPQDDLAKLETLLPDLENTARALAVFEEPPAAREGRPVGGAQIAVRTPGIDADERAVARRAAVSTSQEEASSSNMLDSLRNAATQSALLAVLGAERQDQDMAFRGLRNVAIVERALRAEPTRASMRWQAEIANMAVIPFERVLCRVALSDAQLDVLLGIFPGPTSAERFRQTLRIAPQQTFWRDHYQRRYGFADYFGVPERLERGAIEEALLLPSAAYATIVDSASDVARAHDACLGGKIMFGRFSTYPTYAGARDVYGLYRTFTTPPHAEVLSAHGQVHLTDAIGALIRAGMLLEKHRLLTGVYPESIDELAPDLRKVYPSDWSNSGKLTPVPFRRTSDTSVTAYIAGSDQRDDWGADGDIALRIDRP